MMEKALSLAAAWWRARTERERSLLSIGAALVLGVLLPALAYQAAARYREHGAVALAEAREIESNVELLASAPRTLALARGSIERVVSCQVRTWEQQWR